MTAASGKRLGRVLVSAGLITEEQLEGALGEGSGRSLSAVLVDQGVADEMTIARTIAENMGLAFVDIGAVEIDPTATTLLQVDLARRHICLPIKIQDDELVVAMSDPANIFAIDDLRIVTGYDIRPVVAAESDLLQAIDRFATMQESVDDMVTGVENLSTGVGDEEEEGGADDEAPVAKILNHVVTEAIRQGAGDIYIEPGEHDIRVRYRIDGVCQEVMRSPKKIHRQLISRLKIQCAMDISERRIPQDGRFGVVLDGKSVDFRVAVLPTVQGEMSVMRLLRKDAIMMSLEDLGFLEQPMERVLDAIDKPYGALLVTGPTGSGKSTTLYAAINKTTKPTVNLITVEDPVEYRLEGLSQVQVHEKAGLTFAAALRSILRQDPDVVMIGEIRDKETATIAIEAALTGHLVLSTLHTNDAPKTLTRLVDMGVKPYAIATSVSLIIAQRLARRLCNSCKAPAKIPAEALKKEGFGDEEIANGLQIFQPVGCSNCTDGYKGRTGLYEVMPVSDAIGRIIMEGGSVLEIKEQASREGVWGLPQAGINKVRMGITSLDEVNRVTVD